MKKTPIRVLALLLILVLLLTGCDTTGATNFFNDVYHAIEVAMTPSFDEMEYTRPDPEQFQADLDHCMEQAKTETDVDKLMELVFDIYEDYHDFVTNYHIANIHYYGDMSDDYWNDEYTFCLEASTDVSAGMDNLLYALADCPLREELEADEFFGADFFDDYEGESLWDETFTALMAKENELLDLYYEQNARAVTDPYFSEGFFKNYCYPMEETFLELIKVRQAIAEYAGYESYPDFAYEFNFGRDFTPEQTASYLEQIRKELVPLYLGMDDYIWSGSSERCNEKQMMDYLTRTIEGMGTTTQYAFDLMQKANLYNTTKSDNKYDASFEVYLSAYNTPYLFVNPSGTAQDKLTMVHEFGHFCSDYAAGGSNVGIDVAEIFSQSLEYLSLTKEGPYSKLRMLALASSLSVYVEQSCYARFELEVYNLKGDDLTIDNVRRVYRQALSDFGLIAYGRDRRDYVLIPHFFMSAQYVISYVVSNDVSMQIYQRELAEPGAGVKIWEDNLATNTEGILAFVKEAGLDDPFAEGRMAKVRDLFKELLPGRFS